MADDVPKDLLEKAAIMREFGRRRAAGEQVPEELYVKHVNATNDNYSTGPECGQRIPGFVLPDQKGILRSDPYALSLPSHSPLHTVKGFTLSLAKQVLTGRMDEVIKTIERNARLV